MERERAQYEREERERLGLADRPDDGGAADEAAQEKLAEEDAAADQAAEEEPTEVGTESVPVDAP